MNLTVLVPSEEYKGYAGARIRYGRIAPALAELGINLVIEELSEFDPSSDSCDVLLISKCHDARALVAAGIFSGRGRLVGVDLFDNYFTQTADSRLCRYRNWINELLPLCDFALCSTDAMAQVVERYRPSLPRHVMNDPGPEFDPGKLAATLCRKLADARDGRALRVGWFGIGDNPNFRVGLSDVQAFGESVRHLGAEGMSVELHVLTNARALTAEGLSDLDRLPVPTMIEEWTEEREWDLLDDAHVAFLPVAAQEFSTAKSLNRGVAALAAGCQVLSVGHPLYAVFGELIYRDAAELARDFQSGSLRLRPERIGSYQQIVNACASAETEAARLSDFLAARTPAARNSEPLALVHGHTTSRAAHDLLRTAGGLSVASPCSTAKLDFDVVFRTAPEGAMMLVSKQAARLIQTDGSRRLRAAASINGREFFEVLETEYETTESISAPLTDADLPIQLATYQRSMSEVRRRMKSCFGNYRIVVSEMSTLPFSLAR
jgi:hypothetical protein